MLSLTCQVWLMSSCAISDASCIMLLLKVRLCQGAKTLTELFKLEIEGSQLAHLNYLPGQ